MADTKYITEEYLDRRLDERLGKLEQSILDALGTYTKQVDERFEGIDGRLDGIDKRLDSIDMRLFKVEQKQEQHDEEFRKLHKAYDHLVKSRRIYRAY